MLDFIRPFFEIAFFKRGPETLPSSERYVYQVLTLAVLLSCVFVQVLGRFSTRYLLFYAASIICFAAFIYVLLSFVGKVERFKQTFVAGIGVDIAINIMMLPAAYSTTAFAESSLAFNLGVLATLLSLVWSVAILAEILHSSTELSRTECTVISISINLFMILLSSYI